MLIAIMYSVVRSQIDFTIIMMKKSCSNDEFWGMGLNPMLLKVISGLHASCRGVFFRKITMLFSIVHVIAKNTFVRLEKNWQRPHERQKCKPRREAGFGLSMPRTQKTTIRMNSNLFSRDWVVCPIFKSEQISLASSQNEWNINNLIIIALPELSRSHIALASVLRLS